MRGRGLIFGLKTVLGLSAKGFFIPYKQRFAHLLACERHTQDLCRFFL